MTRCCVEGCKSNSRKKEPGITFHRLPRNLEKRAKWIQNIGRPNWNPGPNIYICSLHFEDGCINFTLDVARVKDDCFPTIFPHGIAVEETAEVELFTPSTSRGLSLQQPCSSAVSSGKRIVLSPTTHNIKSGASTLRTMSQQVSMTTIKKLSERINIQKKNIKRLRQKVNRQAKKIVNLESIIRSLKDKNFISDESCSLLEDCAGPKEFLIRQISKTKNLPLKKKYNEEIRKFALTLNFLSPKAYKYVRETYNNCLPHPRTLTKWYQHTEAEPGFTAEAFQTLKLKAQLSTNPLLCTLVIDEMAIRKGLYWDSSKKKFYGRIDMGLNVDSDSLDEANESLVMLLTAINGAWKIPVGYFLINSLSGEQKSNLVKKCLQMTYEVGVQIVALTCDGPAANITMLKEFGCDIVRNQKNTSFSYLNNIIHVFLDPCHAVKLIRNTFGELKIFKDKSGREINFNYVEMLLKLQEEEGLHLGTKLTKSHIEFINQKMKVRLATQLFSNSVADALDFCNNELKLKEFAGSSATAYFIRLINDVFDVLNSHSLRPPGWKKALCPQNIIRVTELFKEADEYIRNLKLSSGQVVISSRRKTGFIGLLADMNSALNLFKLHVEENKLIKYLPLYKISQDHLELFFSAIRSKGGYNNNPNAVQFKAAYKRLLIRAEIRDGGIGNCIPLEQINILNCSSVTSPIENINNLTERRSFVEVEEDDSTLYENYLDYLNNAESEYTEHVIVYIAGFVTRSLCRKLQCDECLGLLRGSESDFGQSLIKVKSRGGLTYPSQSVVKIIKDTEKIIKPHLMSNVRVENYYLYAFKFLLDHFQYDNVLVSNNLDHDSAHKFLLIKAIINKYIDIRFKYFGKKATERVSTRNYLTKLILFRNE